MLAELIVTAWLAAQTSTPPCFITGEVFYSLAQTSALLSSNCPIHIERKGTRIKMTSPKWVVQVDIPEEPGMHEFVYRWGQREARIGNHVVNVAYEPTQGA